MQKSDFVHLDYGVVEGLSALKYSLTAACFVLKVLLSPSLRGTLLLWICSQRKGYLLNTPSPWITFNAIDTLRARLGAGMRVFEYGCGGSTLFWEEMGAAQVISVEHDPEWTNLVSARVRRAGIIDLRCIPPERTTCGTSVASPASPQDYLSSDERYSGYCFQKYASHIDLFPDYYFDVVLIDGRARPSCIKHAASKLRIGGMLILDNSDRDYYLEETLCYLGNFGRERFVGLGPCVPAPWVTDIFSRLR